MAKTYRVTRGTRVVNSLFRAMTHLGVGASYRHIFTVPGRKTGRLHSTPVDVMELGAARWLVAPYGPVNWVRNVRASGEVTLTRGRRSQRYRAREVSGLDAMPVLHTYINEVRVTRPYFDAAPDAPDEVVAREVEKHPVFRLEPMSG